MSRRQTRQAVRPPDRDGVGASRVVLPPGPWRCVVDFISERFPAVSAADWRMRMQQGDIIDRDGQAVAPDAPYCAGTVLFYYRHLPAEPRIPFEESVLYQDDYLVVADKPHFLPVTPSGRYVQETLLVRLKRRLGIPTLTPMHRIDRETAGLVLFTIRPPTRDLYQGLFRDRSVEKIYEAIAPLRADLALPTVYRSRLIESPAFMQMQESEGAPNSETMIELLQTHGALGRYRLSPVTGRKHQLRAHMATLGMPIVGDRIYPRLLPEEGEQQDFRHPLQLLAKSIRFTDPISGRVLEFESRQRLSWPT